MTIALQLGGGGGGGGGGLGTYSSCVDLVAIDIPVLAGVGSFPTKFFHANWASPPTWPWGTRAVVIAFIR